MSKPSFEAYFAKYPVRVFKKGWAIINAGDELKNIYYLKTGYVRLYSISSEGKELTLIIYKSGDFFPIFTALMPPAPYRYWVETMTTSEIITVPAFSFISYFKKNPDVLLDLAVKIMIRFDGALRRMEYLAFGSVSQRLSSLIIILSERFGKKTNQGVYIEAPFTHKDLANLAGITRETVSTIMSDLKKRELIDYKNHHILVKNISKLTKVSLLV